MPRKVQTKRIFGRNEFYRANGTQSFGRGLIDADSHQIRSKRGERHEVSTMGLILLIVLLVLLFGGGGGYWGYSRGYYGGGGHSLIWLVVVVLVLVVLFGHHGVRV
jgi:Protein of unknown function (DUF3309)